MEKVIPFSFHFVKTKCNVITLYCSTHSYLYSAVACRYELKVQLPDLTKARAVFSFITEYFNVYSISLH